MSEETRTARTLARFQLCITAGLHRLHAQTRRQWRFALVLPLLVLVSCTTPGEEVLVNRQGVRLRVPAGWRVQQNDQPQHGALIVLAHDRDSKEKSVICLWFDEYDTKLANEFQIRRGEVWIRFAVTGVDATLANSSYTSDMASVLSQPKTSHTWMDWKAAKTDVTAAVWVPAEHDKRATNFAVSLAARGSSLEDVRLIADGLVTQVLEQLKR